MMKLGLPLFLLLVLSTNVHADAGDKFKVLQQEMSQQYPEWAKAIKLLTLDVFSVDVVKPCHLTPKEPDLCDADVIKNILRQTVVMEESGTCHFQDHTLIARLRLKGGDEVSMYTSYPLPALVWLDFQASDKCVLVWETVDVLYEEWKGK